RVRRRGHHQAGTAGARRQRHGPEEREVGEVLVRARPLLVARGLSVTVIVSASVLGGDGGGSAPGRGVCIPPRSTSGTRPPRCPSGRRCSVISSTASSTKNPASPASPTAASTSG